jgi:hypothetical protein
VLLLQELLATGQPSSVTTTLYVHDIAFDISARMTWGHCRDVLLLWVTLLQQWPLWCGARNSTIISVYSKQYIFPVFLGFMVAVHSFLHTCPLCLPWHNFNPAADCHKSHSVAGHSTGVFLIIKPRLSLPSVLRRRKLAELRDLKLPILENLKKCLFRYSTFIGNRK